MKQLLKGARVFLLPKPKQWPFWRLLFGRNTLPLATLYLNWIANQLLMGWDLSRALELNLVLF